MSQSNRRAERRTSREKANERHRTLRIAAVGVVSVGVIAVVAVLLLNVLSGGNDAGSPSWSAAAYSGGPRLAVDRALVDEGSIPYNQEVKATYRVKNVGDQPLALQPPTVDVVEGC